MAYPSAPIDNRSKPFLSQNQQDLLLAALSSQASGRQSIVPQTGDLVPIKRSPSDPTLEQPAMSGINGNALFMSPQDAELDNFNGDFTPDLDYLDGDTSFDFENADLGGELIGALPTGQTKGGTEGHEKRKSRDENGSSEEGDAKRQETQEGEKGAKKPGRKPLTNEPTTKRKAQNRAAQRAFRERKEKHVKDLEVKVADLTQAQEADKQANGLLKAQVEQLQSELREYRKRLAVNGGAGAVRVSPPLSANGARSRENSNEDKSNGSNQFDFDFPKFGALSGSQMFGQGQSYANSANVGAQQTSNGVTPPITQSPTALGSFDGPKQPPPMPRANSSGSRGTSLNRTQGSGSKSSGSSGPSTNLDYPPVTTYSSANNMHGFASTLPQMSNNDPFGDLFSPSILKSVSVDGNNLFRGAQKSITKPIDDAGHGGDSTAGLNRVFQFNSGSSASDSASPSASSSSQWNVNGANSSCGTSPEPSHGSPANKADKNADNVYDKVNPQQGIATDVQSTGNPNILFTGNNIDYNVPSAQTFDPVLFGEMRDNNILGDDFTSGFFDEALNPGPYDFGSPSNLFGILQSPQQTNASLNTNGAPVNAATPSRNLMAEIDKTRDGGDEDYGLPSTQTQQQDGAGKLISCDSIWTQLQSNPDFQAGTFDLDSLCSELRVKARCSESGVMVDRNHVDAALKKLGQKDASGKLVRPDLPPLVFEQESWDNVLKKLNQNRQA